MTNSNLFLILAQTYSEIFLINNCQCQNEVKNQLYHPKIWTYGPAVNNLTPNHG
jgi:hypothetical protein